MLDQYFADRRTEIEAALEAYLPSPPSTPAVLADAMRYSVLAGGKRLRPTLTLAAADAVGGADARRLALPAACAVEMIHTYSLIHDDLPAMDDDHVRRGRPTLHVVAGDGMAILAGDGLQAHAFSILAREPVSTHPEITSRKLRALAIVAEAAGPAGMVGGQAVDLEAVKPAPHRRRGALTPDEVRWMHAMKTGRMIRAAAVVGAVMAGADAATTAALDTYASDLGLAFQIVDDILDVEAASHTLGKTAGKDAAAGKPTYPAVFGLEQSRRLAHDCVSRAEQQLHAAGLQHPALFALAQAIVTRSS